MDKSTTAIAENPLVKDHTSITHQRGRLQIGEGGDASPKAQPLLNKLMDDITDMLESGGPRPTTYSALAEWFATVSKARTEGLITEADIEDLRIAFGPAMGDGTMQGRSMLQKYGYAGDFEIIDEIYRSVVSDDTTLKGWDEFYHAQGAPKAVRNRKAYFKQVVTGTLAANPQGIEVLDIASGPCRDIAEFFEANPTANVHFTCVDIDERAIAYAKTLCAPWLDRITFIRSNALRIRFDKTFDLIWSAGLFDYFDDRGFVALLSRLTSFAKPDTGQVAIGNFVNPSPSAACQEFADWFLNYRSREKLVELALACGAAESAIKVKSEEEGINLFLHIVFGQHRKEIQSA